MPTDEPKRHLNDVGHLMSSCSVQVTRARTQPGPVFADRQGVEIRPRDYLLPFKMRTSDSLNKQRRKCPVLTFHIRGHWEKPGTQLFCRTPSRRERIFERLWMATLIDVVTLGPRDVRRADDAPLW